MFRLLAYIASLFCLFFLSQEVFGAENFVGKRIGITGASSDVVIDARAIIDASATVGPAIFDAQTNTLSGGMYIKGIGWAAFATGSYQVTMSDCPPSRHICALNGTGWSDQIGEIDFSGVSYSRIAQKLQGSIRTHAGDFSLDGIDIAYGPASISGGNTLKAHHDTSVRLTNPSRYTGKILTLNLKHIDTSQSKQYTATGGVFWGVDLSIAGTYQASIEVRNPLLGMHLLGMHPDDQLESRTTLSIQVIPNTPTSVRQSGSYALQTYCTTVPNPLSSICPDGTTLQSTTLSTEDASAPADGESTITYTLKLRDQYGNRAQSGSVEIVYDSTLDRIQIGDWDNIHFFSKKGSALVSSSIIPSVFNLTAQGTFPYSGTRDITYRLASYAPTSATSALTLKYITYNGTPIPSPATASPRFTAPWEATVGSGGTIYTITAHNFPLTLTQKTEAAVVENTSVITRFTLKNADSNTYMAIFDKSWQCKKYGIHTTNNPLCDWMLDGSFIAFTKSTLESGPHPIRTFYQTRNPKNPYPITAQTYIYSKIGMHDVLYPSKSTSFKNIQPGNIPLIHFLGPSGEFITHIPWAHQELFNYIRKNVSTLRRNFTAQQNTNYIIGTGANLEIQPIDIHTKRSFIAIGQDILINGNLTPSSENPSDTSAPTEQEPIAIIALTEDGKGGNIIIDGSVTDIHASLIAERGIIGTGATNRQLYIFGSLFTTNVFEQGKCPYFASSESSTSGSTTCQKYNITQLRKDFDHTASGTHAQHSTAQATPYTPVVIEQNPHLITNPPPGLIEIE